MLELDRLRVTRAGRPVLDDVSLRVHPGEALAVLGQNGAGKSTLLDAVCGLLPLSSGTARLLGDDLAALSVADRARRIASLGQRPVAVALTVRERIAQGLYPVRGRAPASDPAVRAVAEELDLATLLDEPLSQLSGGQQKRAHLARVFVHPEARLFVLDEPFASLDVGKQDLVASALRRRTAAGASVLIAAHHLKTALDCTDIVLGLQRGRPALGPAPSATVDEPRLHRLFAPG